MQGWEYLICQHFAEGRWTVIPTRGDRFTADATPLELLRAMGETGWELCATDRGSDLVLFFKRPHGEVEPTIILRPTPEDIHLAMGILLEEREEDAGPPTDF
jgi:hypothetical protein